MKKVTLDDILNDTVPDKPVSRYGDLATWDNKPGGTVVDGFTEDGIEYVWVEFENSPGERYLYLR